jgi:hypothetical protein
MMHVYTYMYLLGDDACSVLGSLSGKQSLDLGLLSSLSVRPHIYSLEPISKSENIMVGTA